MSDVSAQAASSSGAGAPEATDATFVEWLPLPGNDGVTRRAAPRLYHKKSRTGCQQCKARRVKCDEVHPVCGGCRRHQSLCIYSRTGPGRATERSEPKAVDIRPKANAGKNVSGTTVLDLPESRERRLLELRLLHHFMTATSISILGATDMIFRETFVVGAPNLALDHDSLLYSIYTLSALHLAKCEPHNLQAVEAYQKYLDLTLRGHRDDVDHLSKDNADAACLTSSNIRLCAFAILQERPLNPYTPPTQWLQMTSGSVNVFKEAWAWITGNEKSLAWGLINKRRPMLVPFNQELFQESYRQDLLHLLRRSRTDDANEPWDEAIQQAYESTISYLGGIRIAISTNETPPNICRRLMVFPMMVDKRFIELIKEQQPRALVVLAHFFALLARFSDLWWLGNTGKREILGIQTVLPAEWQDLMSWPLAAMEEGSLLTQ